MADPGVLVEAGEVEFDRALETITMKDLVHVITYLQSEIVTEQNNFQSLHEQLANMTDLRSAEDSAAHRRISQELVECQDRIGMLMQKNIKCFSASNARAKIDETSETVNGTTSEKSNIKADASAKLPVVDSIPTGGTVKALRSTVWHNDAPQAVRPLASSALTTRRSRLSLNGDGTPNNVDSNGNERQKNNNNAISSIGSTGSTCSIGSTDSGSTTASGRAPLTMPKIHGDGAMHYVEHREVVDIAAGGAGDFEGDEELVTAFDERPSLLNWDPILVLNDLYRIEQMDPSVQDDLSRHYVIMEGYLEKLPMNTKETSVLKVWKKRYCKAERGNLFYYKEKHDSKSLGFVQLMGATVREAAQRVIKIDDQRGHLLTLRCTSDREHGDWLVALQSQTIDDTPHSYIKPVLNPEPNPDRNVVIIDIGGASVRAGILGNMPSLPDIFFPFVVAVNKVTGEHVYGVDAYKPEIRTKSKLIHPMKPSARLDKVNLSGAILSGLLTEVFTMLNIDPSLYTLERDYNPLREGRCYRRLPWQPRGTYRSIRQVMLSTANVLTSSSLQELMTSLFGVHAVRAVCMMYQSVLALYSYSSTLGVVIDLGERCDIVPVIDGYVMSGNSSKQPYGGGTVSERLSQNLAEHKHRFYTDTEKLFTRLAKEKYCYVSGTHDSDMEKFYRDRSAYLKTVMLSRYYLPSNAFSEITIDSGTFHAAEGLFEPGHWGQDTPALHKATHRVIQQCPMDARKDLCRNIYLSGGSTLLRGLAERLQTELQALFKSQSVQIQVHASPYRYHAAYIGACVLAMLDDFPSACVTPDQWSEDPGTCIRKLQAI